jgi:hypothetical protein
VQGGRCLKKFDDPWSKKLGDEGDFAPARNRSPITRLCNPKLSYDTDSVFPGLNRNKQMLYFASLSLVSIILYIIIYLLYYITFILCE